MLIELTGRVESMIEIYALMMFIMTVFITKVDAMKLLLFSSFVYLYTFV